MQGSSKQPGGRGAAPAELRRRLPGASGSYLSEALQNPRLGRTEVLALLLNRRAESRHLVRIARDPRWRKSSAVLLRLAVHPATPPAEIRGRLELLGWRDLAEVSVAPTAHPTVRRRAESLLSLRLEELSGGERVALARRAPRAIIGRLLESEDERVLRSLLGNGRLSEHHAVRLAAAPHAPGPFLQYLSEHADWGCRRDVRMALARNAATPVPAALRALEGLAPGDLKRLDNDDKVPAIVRVGAARILERGTRGTARPPRPAVG